MSPQSETEFSMLDTTQLDQDVFRVNMLDALRTSALRDGDGCNVVVMPTLADFPWRRIESDSHCRRSFAGYFPITEAPNLLPYTNTFANYFAYGAEVETNWVRHSGEQIAPEGRFTLIQIQPSAGSVEYFPQDAQPEPYFDFSCDVIVSALDVLAEYVAESERSARESWKRLCRRNISSSAVSKNGHLSFLLPSYRRVCVETAARDQVVHLEVITLAEEHEAPGASAVGQRLISGGESWMRMKSRLLNLLSGCLEKVPRFGFIDAGFNFATAEAL
jgi:hypothetical protein